MNSVPIVRDVCLVGGGHSHALLVRRWAMRPLAGVRLTLVSSNVQTPYSGMLPGLIAGHYCYDDIHIDLLKLCCWADVRFVEGTVTDIDLSRKHVCFDNRPDIGFDVLSLDTGSTPDLSVPGSAQHVTAVKPVSDFHSRWMSIQHRLANAKHHNVSIGVVGSGAGGFELVTAMQHRLRSTSARCYWFLRRDDAIGGRTAKVGKLAIAAAEKAGIEVVRRFDVVAVEQNKLIARDGREVELDEILWCTAATGPAWPADAGLDTDKRGFVATNAHLQSISHPFVFATGDIGTQKDTPSSKAGVFAVRQAPVLYQNIRRYLLNDRLKVYTPQRDFLSLMATGPCHAIASRGSIVTHANWVWRWKNRIDQTFMDKFSQLPTRRMNASLARLPNALQEPSPLRCRGCGAKVGHDVLQSVLSDLLPADTRNGAANAWSPAGDTAVISLPDNMLVQSVDQINAIVDDPYLLGRIAALHAISDVITLDTSVHSAQVLLTVPESSEQVVERDLRLLMSGLLSVLDEESCVLVGGHTAQSADMSVGLTINATMRTADKSDDQTWRIFPEVASGDALIVTQALGVGVLFAGLMQGKAKGTDISRAIDNMLVGNRLAASILREHGCVGMTDITGFGLLGHLLRLLEGLRFGSSHSATVEHKPAATLVLEHIAFLSGAVALSQQGCRSSLFSQNSQSFTQASIDELCDPAITALLADPQTSGGLLGVIPAGRQALCVKALNRAGYNEAALVGFIQPAGTHPSSHSVHVVHSLELP